MWLAGSPILLLTLTLPLPPWVCIPWNLLSLSDAIRCYASGQDAKRDLGMNLCISTCLLFLPREHAWASLLRVKDTWSRAKLPQFPVEDILETMAVLWRRPGKVIQAASRSTDDHRSWSGSSQVQPVQISWIFSTHEPKYTGLLFYAIDAFWLCCSTSLWQ